MSNFKNGDVVRFKPQLTIKDLQKSDIYIDEWHTAIGGAKLNIIKDRHMHHTNSIVQCDGFEPDDDGVTTWWVPAEFLELVEEPPMSMTEGVAFTNMTFGKNKLDPLDPDFWIKLEAQANLIKSELDELFEGIEEKDMVKIRDGVSDVLVTTLGVPHLVGFDVEADMQAVLVSNLSKVSKTIEDAEFTSGVYAKKGIKTFISDCPTMPGYIVKVSGDQVDSNNTLWPNDKFLKCKVSFKEPVFVN